MIVVPNQEEITLEFEDGAFLLSQISANQQSYDQIEIASLTAMKGFIAFLQDIVEKIESGKEANE
ncbi:hypothetical protein [Brucella anthropi]|uniref:hypothetical protein n=1 Tax=Brucella anthropi TaxID=529 RepID=UPI00384CE854